MNRKTFLLSGLFLSIVYALSLVAAIAFFAVALLLYFASDVLASMQDILSQILGPILLIDGLILLIASAILLAFIIILLIASTRFIKYSRAPKEIYGKKRGLLIFYIILVFLAFAGLTYLLVSDILTFGLFSSISQVLIWVLVGIHLICVVTLIIGIIKHKGVINVPQPQVQDVEQYVNNQPAIYTSDLEDVEQPIQEQVQQPAPQVEQTTQTTPLEPAQKSASQKLVEEIGKLDEMRKNGTITQQEYVKLRQGLIKNFIK